MHKIVNPQQTRLFDPFDSVLTEKTRKRLLDGWSGVFRHVILELMPVDTIAGYFNPAMGRPTKELYSMAGLLLIMEFMNWTKEEALDAYRFHLDIQYALNLENETDKTKTVMPESACSQCEFFEQCPVEKIKGQYALEHTSKQRRRAGRRREQDTEVFRERYKTRGGIEGTNSALKRKTGLDQLRVRGRPAVFHAIYLKIAGWNILRASVCAKIRESVYARANMATFWLNFAFLRMTIAVETVRMDLKRRFLLPCREFEKFSTLSLAA